MILNKFFYYFNKISPVIIQTPWVGAVGNCAEEIYFGLLRAKRENKKVFFIFPKDLFGKFKFSKSGKGINQELLNIESPYRFLSNQHIVSIFSCWCLTLIYISFRIVFFVINRIKKIKIDSSYLIPDIGQESLWSPEKRIFNKEEVYNQNWDKQMSEKLPVKIPDKSLIKAVKMRDKMKLPKKSWFVCLHVREGGYYGFKESKHKEARNSDIKNYLKAIEYITEKGGWVVRMGDSTMTPLPAMKNVIDYPHTEFKSYLMDIYLIQECKFYIGSQSGIWDVATLFQKPILMPNMVEWLFTYPQRKGDLGIIKHIFSVSKKRYLSLEECTEVFLKFDFEILHDIEHEFHDNTPEEIYDLVKEYINFNEMESELQKKWNLIRIENGFRVLDRLSASSKSEYFRLASRLIGSAGSLSHKFLEKNWNNNTMNKN